MLITYVYRVGFNYIPGTIVIHDLSPAATEYDIKNLICIQLRDQTNKCFCVYDIEILGMKRTA